MTGKYVSLIEFFSILSSFLGWNLLTVEAEDRPVTDHAKKTRKRSPIPPVENNDASPKFVNNTVDKTKNGVKPD